MNQITLNFKNQSVLVDIADTPAKLIRIEGMKNLLTNELREWLSGMNKISSVLSTIVDAIATFTTICPEDLCRIYFGKSLKEANSDINNLLKDDIFSNPNSKERIIVKELVREYKKYKEAEGKILSFDEDGFPLFRKETKSEENIIPFK